MGASSSQSHYDVVVIGIKVGPAMRRRYFLAPRDAPIYEACLHVKSKKRFRGFRKGEGVYALYGDGRAFLLNFVGAGGEMGVEQVHSLVTLAQRDGYRVSEISRLLTSRDREAIFRGIK